MSLFGKPSDNKSDELDIALGKDNYRVINVIGKNNNLSILNSDVWDGGVLKKVWLTIPTIHNLVSTSVNDSFTGTHAKIIKLFGLNENFEEIDEIIFLNGTTPVNTVKQYLRINMCNVIDVGVSGNSNDGVITISDGTNVQGKILQGNSFLQNSHYSIPKGWNAYVKILNISTDRNGIAVLDTIANFKFNNNPNFIQPINRFSLGGTNELVSLNLDYFYSFPEKSDLWVSSSSVSGVSEIVVYYTIILKKIEN